MQPEEFPKEHFDNPGFFENEISALKGRGFIKELTVNGKTSHLKKEAVDWKTELEIFRGIQLNKPAFSGKIKIDSLHDGEFQNIQYTASDKKIPVKSYSVSSFGGDVKQIEISIDENSLLHQYNVQLSYRPGVGYSLIGSQRMKGLESENFNVSARFIP